MKQLILVSISLFLLSSLTFASDLKEVYLKGEWYSAGYICRLSDEEFIKIITLSGSRYTLEFKDDNEVIIKGRFVECNMLNTGTYSIKDTRLDILLDSINIRATYPGVYCVLDNKKTISYEEVILKNGSLYLKDYNSDKLLVQQCPGGTIFQHLVRKSTI